MSKTIEPGYKAVLVHEETKKKLQDFRRGLKDRDQYQERQIATAALNVCLSDPELMKKVISEARNVVISDWQRDEMQ